eukprot:1117409-Rhodomonas_salina.2
MQSLCSSFVRMRPHLLPPLLSLPLRRGSKHLIRTFQPKPSHPSRGFSLLSLSPDTADLLAETPDGGKMDENTQKIPVAAAFSHGLESQIAQFKEFGYVVLKGSGENRSELSELLQQTLAFSETTRSTWLSLIHISEPTRPRLI